MHFEIYKAGDGWRFRLRAANGQIIAVASEGYVRKASAEHAIELLKGIPESTEVEEVNE